MAAPRLAPRMWLAALACAAAGPWAPPAARADETGRERISTRLVEHGFENVDVRDGEATVTVWYENRIYRYEMTALGAVALLAAPVCSPQDVLELVPLNRTLPIISVAAPVPAWLAFLNGEMDEAAFREVLEIHENGLRGGGGLAPPAPERRNPSRWRTDAAVRPLFEFQLGVADDPFEYSLHLAPELTSSPFPRGLITLQGAIRLHDDLDPCGSEDPCGSWIKPVRNTLSWGGWLPGGILLAASAGTFPGDRYGFAGEAGRLIWDGQIEVWAGGDLSGELQFLEDLIEYSSPKQWSAFVAATHRTPAIDLESTVQVGRFREESEAVRVEVARRFHEFELAFFGIANEDDTVAGVHIKLPLPLTRYLKPAPFRLTTVPEFPFTYRDSRGAIGVQIPLFDNMDRLRKRLYPTFIRNNLEDLRRARREIEESRG